MNGNGAGASKTPSFCVSSIGGFMPDNFGSPCVCPECLGLGQAMHSYIRQHATEGMTVQQAARAAGMNRTYYSVALSEKAEMPPSEFITQARMESAKRLLAETDASITEVAYTTGYSPLYAFMGTFEN